MKYLEDFPDDVSSAIKKFILNFKSENPDFFGANLVIREDVFSILEKKAVVVFFPLKNEENDGFHVKRTVNGECVDFVYINTAKSIEKQVFTAAHELGHRLDIEKYVADVCPAFNIEKYTENIVNRFAAMLLVPEDVFRKSVSSKLDEIRKVGDIKSSGAKIEISIIDVFRLIVFLMDYFFVPFKTIVYRLEETNIITKSIRNLILSSNENNSDLLEKCIQDGQYQKLNKPSLKTSITGYSELLEKAEINEVLPLQKISKIREQFGIPKIEANDDIDLPLNIKE